MSTAEQVESMEAFRAAPEEYQEACRKIVISHAINELYGSQVYDEPAIAMAPNPYAKWLTCRVVMEEYGHHYRFFELGREMGVAEDRMLPEKTDKSGIRRTRDQACAFAEEHDATLGQVNAVKKALTEGGYYVSPR